MNRYAFNDTRWSTLREELSKILHAPITLYFPRRNIHRIHALFRESEQYAFRTELQYSQAELDERLGNPGVLLLFVLKEQEVEAMLFGYEIKRPDDSVFYLDVIAVRRRGIGVGRHLLETLIQWAHPRFSAIRLDTEDLDEKGIHLTKFYEESGFKVVGRAEDGDITMERRF